MRKEELPSLTGIRFYAAVPVYLSHVAIIPGVMALSGSNLFFNSGDVGVSFFFVLSGFILTYNYADVFRGGVSAAKYGQFVWDQLTKIYPVHALTLLLVLPIAVFSPQKPLDWRAVPFHLTLLQCLWPASAPAFWEYLNVPSWSISCEGFFYLLTPTAVFFALGHRRRWVPMIVVIGYACGLAARGGSHRGEQVAAREKDEIPPRDRARGTDASHQGRSERGEERVQSQPQHNTRRPAALKAPWRPAPERMPHQESEIERARVDDQPLEDVRMPAQVDPAQPAGVIDVRKRPLDVLAAAPHQPLPARAAHATAIAIDRVLGLRRLGTAATAASGLSEVATDAEGPESQQGVVAVIAAITDERRRDGRLHGRQLFGRRQRRREQTRRVADVRPVQGHGDQGAGLQIDRMLDLVGEVGPSVFQLRDLGIGVRRIHPLRVGRPLLTSAVEPGQRLAARRLEAGGHGQPREELLVALPRVPPHDAPHRGVRLERGHIHGERLAPEQVGVDQALLHPREYRLMRLDVDQAAGARDRRMIGRRLVEAQAQKVAYRQRVRCPPGDPALRVEPFEIADQQQAEVPARREAGPSHHRRIERPTVLLNEAVEACSLEDLVQAHVERVPRRHRELGRGDPQRRLLARAF